MELSSGQWFIQWTGSASRLLIIYSAIHLMNKCGQNYRICNMISQTSHQYKSRDSWVKVWRKVKFMKYRLRQRRASALITIYRMFLENTHQIFVLYIFLFSCRYFRPACCHALLNSLLTLSIKIKPGAIDVTGKLMLIDLGVTLTHFSFQPSNLTV